MSFFQSFTTFLSVMFFLLRGSLMWKRKDRLIYHELPMKTSKLLNLRACLPFVRESTAAEGFVPSHAPLKNNKHLNIPFQSTQQRREKDRSKLQGLTPLSQDRACRMRRGVWGCASILSVTPNAAPDKFLQHCLLN